MFNFFKIKIRFADYPQKGFTLLEVMMSVFIFTVLAYGAIILIGNLFTSSGQQSLLLADTDQARKVAFNFANELRNAAVANDGSYPLNLAGDQQIIFYSTTGAVSPAVNRIRYFINNKTLFKGIIVPAGNPLSYNPAAETVVAVQNDVANGNNRLFYYYDGTYNGNGAAMAQPINVTAVKFAKINLVILNKGGVANTGTDSVSAGATIRNLKTNLGN